MLLFAGLHFSWQIKFMDINCRLSCKMLGLQSRLLKLLCGPKSCFEGIFVDLKAFAELWLEELILGVFI